jgi:hypothetical protein
VLFVNGHLVRKEIYHPNSEAVLRKTEHAAGTTRSKYESINDGGHKLGITRCEHTMVVIFPDRRNEIVDDILPRLPMQIE